MQTGQSRGRFDLRELTQSLSPALLTMGAVLLVILGILIILFPELLRWVTGIGLILVGVGVLASVTMPQR